MAKKSRKKKALKKTPARARGKTKKSKTKKSKAVTAKPKAKTKPKPKPKPKARRKVTAKAPSLGQRLSNAYHTVVDTVTGTGALRDKLEKPGTSESE